MKLLENKLDERLHYIESLILKMGGYVEKTIASACDILLEQTLNSTNNMQSLKVREKTINTLQLKVSRFCFKILAKESPVAKDLRLVLAILNTNSNLERMGDLAFNIAERASFVKVDPALEDTMQLFKTMFFQVSNMVHQSLNAFIKVDNKQARNILIQDDIVNKIRDDIRLGLESITLQHKELIKPCIDLIIIAGEVERIADHTTNIAEEIIFLKTGDDIRHQDISDTELYQK